LGAPRLDSPPLSPPGAPRENLCDFRNFLESRAAPSGPLLPSFLRQHRTRGSLCLSARVAAATPRPLIVLLDNSSTHNDEGELMQKLLARHPRLKIEHFPSYAPELNPDEGVWALAKEELANGCPKNGEGLMESIICAIDGIRKSPAKLRGCILQSDLPLFLS
jgi:DDE superfamily endonuclease